MTAAMAVAFSMVTPANAQLFSHTASGQGTDGIGNRLSILAAETLLVSVGVAFVRPRGSSQTQIVLLDCLIWDERPGPGFHFLYSNGIALSGRTFYLGVFDDAGPGRTGPYDVIYVQEQAVNGPCGVAAVSSYPIGWDPVSSGDYVVE